MNAWLGLSLSMAAVLVASGCSSDDDDYDYSSAPASGVESKVAAACAPMFERRRDNLPEGWVFLALLSDGNAESNCYLAGGERARDIALARCQEDAAERGQASSDCLFYKTSDDDADEAGKETVVLTITDDPQPEPEPDSSSDGAIFGEVLNNFVNDAGAIAGAVGAMSGSGNQSVPSYQQPNYSGVDSSNISQGGGGSVSIGDQAIGNSPYPSCGRRWVGMMPQSACRAAGNLPDSSITSDDVPDPVAPCYTPPCP